MIRLLLVVSVVLTGCVSNKAVRTIKADDFTLNCKQLKFEMINLGEKFDETKAESGLTSKNIGLALVFWPGIIVNEVRSNKNQESIDSRIEHLTNLYSSKCLAD